MKSSQSKFLPTYPRWAAVICRAASRSYWFDVLPFFFFWYSAQSFTVQAKLAAYNGHFGANSCIQMILGRKWLMGKLLTLAAATHKPTAISCRGGDSSRSIFQAYLLMLKTSTGRLMAWLKFKEEEENNSMCHMGSDTVQYMEVQIQHYKHVTRELPFSVMKSIFLCFLKHAVEQGQYSNPAKPMW